MRDKRAVQLAAAYTHSRREYRRRRCCLQSCTVYTAMPGQIVAHIVGYAVLVMRAHQPALKTSKDIPSFPASEEGNNRFFWYMPEQQRPDVVRVTDFLIPGALLKKPDNFTRRCAFGAVKAHPVILPRVMGVGVYDTICPGNIINISPLPSG